VVTALSVVLDDPALECVASHSKQLRGASRVEGGNTELPLRGVSRSNEARTMGRVVVSLVRMETARLIGGAAAHPNAPHADRPRSVESRR